MLLEVILKKDAPVLDILCRSGEFDPLAPILRNILGESVLDQEVHAGEGGDDKGQEQEKALTGGHVQETLSLRVLVECGSGGIAAAASDVAEQRGPIVSHEVLVVCVLIESVNETEKMEGRNGPLEME